jgi:biopolymer transport protein ExbD
MSRAKVTRKSTAIDMTAMCDVAFLLLTFFILSAKPKVPDPVKADVPAASVQLEAIPETDFAIITVGEGKAFFQIEGDDVRKGTIEAMGEAYGAKFTPEQINKFQHLDNFGLPLNVLPAYLDLPQAQQAAYKQPGIPFDTTENNELAKWVLQARKANAALHNVEIRIAIKADAETDYPVVNTIIKSLGKQKLDKFSLITSAKLAPKVSK